MDLEERITEALLSSRSKSVMLLGGPDTGKTALAAAVVDLLSKKGRAGVLDLDMGQSHGLILSWQCKKMTSSSI